MRGRLLYVIGSLDVGGAEQHLLQLLPQLKARGYQPAIYTIGLEGVLAPKFVAKGINVYSPPLANYLQSLPSPLGRLILLLISVSRLFVLLLTLRPAVVHFFLPEAYLVGGLVSLLIPGLCRVMSRRSLDFYQARCQLLARIERWLHQKMNTILGNSRAVNRQLRGEGVLEDRLGLIYNGLDMSAFEVAFDKKHVRNEFGLTLEGLVFISVANLISYKGHEDLLKAFGMVKDRLPLDWTLLCIGRDTGIGDDLQALAEDLSIASHIRWMGLRQDVIKLLQLSDIGLLASHQEGFSNAILEGMAAGLPMIVTDVGGNSEAVLNGQTGLVVPPHQSTALGDAIVELAMNRGRISTMGMMGRARIYEFFSLNDCVDRYENLYMGLLGKKCSTTSEIISGQDSKGII